MRTDPCQCGQTLFFENTICIRCQSPIGWCPVCRRMSTLVATIDGFSACHHEDCRAKLKLCHNYSVNNVCNWTVPCESEDRYCESCQLTEVIPDLIGPEQYAKWFKVEAAKRRLVYELDLLNLPFATTDPRATPPLRFRFLDPEVSAEPVTTGHENGLIILNLNEADDVEREKNRVALGEPQRTLLRHFRHEIGHYYWDVLVSGHDEIRFREIFGDERNPTYGDAMKTYYANGPKPNWQAESISAYATMHPWEDFAETFAGYLDLVSLLDTVLHQKVLERLPQEFPDIIQTYQQQAIILNELNRDRGLCDLVPEVLNAKVQEKLTYIHELVSADRPAVLAGN